MSAIPKQRFEEIMNLYAYVVNESGEVSTIPIIMNLSEIGAFVSLFRKKYLIFRDGEGQEMFEVSGGILVFVNPESGLSKEEIRRNLYRRGITCIR